MIYAIFMFILGVCIGSFSNVLIYRLPLNQSINFPASHCTSCNTPLKWYHNVPLFSWLFLGGKCAFCKAKISPQYPIVEFLAGILMVLAYYYEINTYEFSIAKALVIGVCFIVLLALSAIDFKYKAVPDSLLWTSIILSLIYSLMFEFDFSGAIGGAILAASFAALRFIVSFALKREAMGSADIFIAFVMGAILGTKLAFVAVYFAAIFTIPAYILVRKKNYELPFVPFLALGLLATYLCKPQILELLVKIYG